jgi:alpha-beta hydrolase superfamily lysophospholipase
VRYAIRVTSADGAEMWLRHGAAPGRGPVVIFHSMREASVRLEFVKLGLDEGEVAHIVPVRTAGPRGRLVS